MYRNIRYMYLIEDTCIAENVVFLDTYMYRMYDTCILRQVRCMYPSDDTCIAYMIHVSCTRYVYRVHDTYIHVR